ncbi:MAG: hypothetical protein HYU73_17800 [Betaproteobacteria bacterium]|nr:hypothetical protein [Betaproteobacteria bacterium]MBI3057225.1 hypothetical protein [Betaproteobacteria bacterium]
MAERKVLIDLPSGKAEGVELQVEESTERWSDITLSDGAVLRVKASVVSAVRIVGHYDPLGNPMYQTNVTPIATVVSVPDHLRKKVQ